MGVGKWKFLCLEVSYGGLEKNGIEHQSVIIWEVWSLERTKKGLIESRRELGGTYTKDFERYR